MITGFDLSNHDNDSPFNAATVQELITNGMQFAILGCYVPAIAHMQANLIKPTGARLQGMYAFLYWGQDTTGQTQQAIDIALAHKMPYVWLDCEADPPYETADQTPATRIAHLRACVKQVEGAGLKAGIYTGKYYWEPKMGNTSEFAHLPLWHASYWNDRHYQDTVDYGGWTRVAIHQYASSPAIAGRNRDYNVMFDWFIPQAFGEGEDDMSDADKQAIAALQIAVAKQADLIERLSFAVMTGPEDGDISLAQKRANAAYRIAQIVDKDPPGGPLQSVGSRAQAALNLIKAVAAQQSTGLSPAQIDGMIADAFERAAQGVKNVQ